MPDEYDDWGDMYEDMDFEEDEDDCDSDREPMSDDIFEDYDGPDNPLIDGVGFADPTGKSALRAATRSNPRNLPCPTCKAANRLTAADKRAGYQCDTCANRDEGGYGY